MVEWGFMDAQAFCECGMSHYYFYNLQKILIVASMPRESKFTIIFFFSHRVCFGASDTGRRNSTSQEKKKRELFEKL